MGFANNSRRVVITGIGIVCPLGSSPEEYWSALAAGRSGVVRCEMLPSESMPLKFAGEARQFTGAIDNFGPLDGDRKKAIRKGLKVMCRDTQMAIATAQLALADAGLLDSPPDPTRSGVVVGSDYMLTMPADLMSGIRKCAETGDFEYGRWGNDGLGETEPLWMLKYLPNMPASHIAIFNDLRGPNNSLTMREAAGVMSLGEAFRTIERGHADLMIAGATGTRLLPMQAIHVMQTEQLANEANDPASASRPFDKHRSGMVAGEGAGMLILESADSAQARGARTYGEVLGFGASSVADRNLNGRCDVALINALRAALADADIAPADIGHVNAHGLSTRERDIEESRAIRNVFNGHADDLPVTAIKSFFGNLGAASGVVELAASLLAMQHGRLPRVLNYRVPDPECRVCTVTDDATAPGETFVKLSVTPQGQAAAICIGR
ncbi:MAG: beta-ketoacyl-[acyl-carrier-protein] synthase family protein [Pirellulales bacterium]